jgi:signal peptidase II
MKLSTGKIAILTILLVLFIDQCFKIWIKTHMMIGEDIHVAGNWFIIHFTENNGMAFGWEFGGSFGKLFLSSFRIIAVAGIGWYLVHIIKNQEPVLFIVSIALIFAGAIGNIIDSAFYGLIFSSSDIISQAQVNGDIPMHCATLFPSGGGYSTFLHGKVVDMLYFPLIEGHFPSWFPIWGSEEFTFFRPVFNIADSSISVGVALILLFQRKLLKN